jgi:uncharacterized damage-inducible protein DinB
MGSDVEEILAKTRSTHAKLLAFLQGIAPDVADRKLGDGWTIRETVGHLVDAEKAHRRFIETVAGGQAMPEVAGFDLNAWNAARVAKRAGQSLPDLVADFERERALTMALLATLTDDARSRVGVHAALGEVSVDYVARIVGLHERSHLQEMQDALKASA